MSASQLDTVLSHETEFVRAIIAGPALVNLGLVSTMVKSHRDDLWRIGTWLIAFAVGGLVTG